MASLMYEHGWIELMRADLVLLTDDIQVILIDIIY